MDLTRDLGYLKKWKWANFAGYPNTQKLVDLTQFSSQPRSDIPTNSMLF